MKPIRILLAALLLQLLLCSGCDKTKLPVTEPSITGAASRYSGEDSARYPENIPLFECSYKSIEEVYYYRGKLYKAHIRQVDSELYSITELISHVPCEREHSAIQYC